MDEKYEQDRHTTRSNPPLDSGDHSANHLSKPEAVARLAELALTRTNLTDLLDGVASLLAGALGMDVCLIYELVPAEDRLVLRAQSGLPEGISPPPAVQTDGDSQAGYTWLADRAVRVTDLSSERRFSDAWLSTQLQVSIGASLVIPGSHQPWGILAVHSHRRQSIKPSLMNYLHTAVRILGAAVERLQNEIGERQRVEQDLRRTESLINQLFESAPDAVILVDTGGRIVRVNQQGEQLFGYSRQELHGKSVDILLPEHLRARHEGLRSAYFKDMRIRPMGIDLELYARRKDLQEFPVEIMLSPVTIQEGSFVISAVRDITERKKLQAELAEVHRMLMENIEAERLRLSRELHDGPIQDLFGLNLELNNWRNHLKDNEDIERVNTLAGGLLKVIDNLRGMCGELRPPTLTPFGLEKAIRAHIQSLNKAQPGLQVKLNLAADKQELEDRLRLVLFRVYQNAISNAIRHARAQQIEVRFSYDSNRVMLEVQDDGLGFNLPKKWVELARQGHFGLVGAAERVKALGGQLDILTAPGEGTLVRAILPRHAGEQQVPDLASSRPVTGQEGR